MPPLRRSTRTTSASTGPYTVSKAIKARKSMRAIKTTSGMKPTKTMRGIKTTRAIKPTKVTKATKATKEPLRKLVKTSRAPKEPMEVLDPNPSDPIDRLPDLCLDIIFSYLPILKLISIRNVSKLWRDTVDWRLGSSAFQRKRCPDISLYVNEGIPQSKDEVVEEFRREVYRQEMRTRGTPTFIRKFTNVFNKGYYKSWELCGDFFVWLDDNSVYIQHVFNLKESDNQRIRHYPIEKFMNFSNFSADQFAIRPMGSSRHGRDPILLMLVYKSDNDDRWNWTGRISTINVVTGKLLWRRGETPSYSRMGYYTHNHRTFSWTQSTYANSPSTASPTGLYNLDILTGNLMSFSRLEYTTGGPVNNPPSVLSDISAHPHRDLIFCPVPEETLIGVFSTTSLAWVAKLKLPYFLVKRCSRCPYTTFNPRSNKFNRTILFEDRARNNPDSHENIYIRLNDLRYCPECILPPQAIILKIKLPSQTELEATKSETIGDARILPIEEVNIFKSNPRLEPRSEQQHYIGGINQMSYSNYHHHHPLLHIHPKTRQALFFVPESGKTSVITQIYKRADACNDIIISAEPGGPHLQELKTTYYTAAPQECIKKRNKKTYEDDSKWLKCILPFMDSISVREGYSVLSGRDKVILISYEPAW